MSTTYDVTAVGNAIVDIVAEIDPSVIDQIELPKGIMSLIELPQSKSIYEKLGPTIESSGGSAGNTIAALAALGRNAAFIGRVRDDQFGEVYAHDMKAIGATFAATPRAEGEETGRCMVMVTPDADRTMATYLGTATDLGPEDLDESAISGAGILYLEGYLWDKPAAKDAFRHAMDLAHKSERRVALTLSDPFCVERHRDSFKEIITDSVDILFANEEELLSLAQTDDFDAALATVADNVAVVAITRSEKGATIVTGGVRVDVPADDVKELVDTTGAGDLFAAGFLNGIALGESPETCGKMGCAAAGVIIQQLGARCGPQLVERFKEGGWIS